MDALHCCGKKGFQVSRDIGGDANFFAHAQIQPVKPSQRFFLLSVCCSSLYSASHLTPKWIDLRYRMKRERVFMCFRGSTFKDRNASLPDLPFLPSVMPRSLPVYPTQIISMNIDFPSVSYLSVSLMCLGILLAVSFMAHRTAVGVIGFGHGFLHVCNCYSFRRVAFSCRRGQKTET